MSGVRFTASPPVRNHSKEGLTQSCKVPSKSPPKAGFCLWTYLRAATVAYRHSGIIHFGPFPLRSLLMQYIGGYPSIDERVVHIRVWPIRDTAISTRLGVANISQRFPSGCSFGLLLLLLFFLLLLFLDVLFLGLFLILLAFFSHYAPPLRVASHRVVVRASPHGLFCLRPPSWTSIFRQQLG